MVRSVSPERKALQRKANLFCLTGLVLQAAFQFLGSTSPANDGAMTTLILIFVIGVGGLVCWIIGLSAYAQSKGYSRWYSLLGLLTCCGLIALVLLPNKWVDRSVPEGYGPGDYPRPNG